MLAKCVNPVCCNQFLFLHQGKLFEVEFQYSDGVVASGHREPVNGKMHVERYWLCDKCAEELTLSFDKRQGLVIHSSLGSVGVPIPFSSSRSLSLTEITQVRIRPLDLNFSGGRDFTGTLKVRRQAA